MSAMYVHTCVDAFGVTQVFFSGSSINTSGFMPKPAFNAALTAVKTIPSGKRKYDPDTKIWYIDNEYWQQMRQFFIAGSQLFTLVEHPDEDSFNCVLTGQPKTKPSWNGPAPDAAKNFYHNFNNVITRIADNKSDKQLLAELLQIQSFDHIPSDKTLANKLYRAAAMRLHPDRNNGDGSKMSELNRIWREYVKF